MTDAKGFLKFKRQEIPRREVGQRLQDWAEVDQPPPLSFLQTQSSRCMDCGVAFCQGDHGCPVNNLIPEWNDLVSQNRWKEAAQRLHSTNNFPEFTGRLCPAPCETACVLGVNSEPVNIKALEWGIIDRAFESDWVQPRPAVNSSGRKVAIIGSGPAGLAAAQQLARLGHEVSVFEKTKSLGGLLRYGIPDFKMRKDLIDRRLHQLHKEGVQFHTSVIFGEDLTFAEISTNFDALVLATGAEVPRDLQIPGRELSGIHFAMDYLIDQNQVLSGERSTNSITARDKRVVILGGGDTGSDCLGTALRQGARQVLQFDIHARPPHTRDPKTPWPLWPMKLKSSHAHEEGGLRHWSLSTEEFLGSGQTIERVRTRRLDLGEGEALGGGEFGADLFFEADLVILAMGFSGPLQTLSSAISGLRFSHRGNLVTDQNLMTDIPGVFAGGDNRRGASLIVWAIAEGRNLAEKVDVYLKTNSLKRSAAL